MNNTEKLLIAFIEASGYEIEYVRNESFIYKDSDMIDGKPKENVAPYHKIVEFDRRVTKKTPKNNILVTEFINGHGYVAGDFVSNNGRYYRSLLGGKFNLNFKQLDDICAWVEYVNEKD